MSKLGIREINFYGKQVGGQIAGGQKLATIRVVADKYKGFQVGQEVIASCEDEEIAIIIWGILELPLNMLHRSLLILDGYINGVLQAEKDLQGYYSEFTEDKTVIFLGIIAKIIFESLSAEQQTVLLAQKEDLTLEEIVANPILQQLFLESEKYWQENQDKL